MKPIVHLGLCMAFASQALGHVCAPLKSPSLFVTTGAKLTPGNEDTTCPTTTSRPVTTALPPTNTAISTAARTSTATISAQTSLCTQYAYASVDGYDLINNLWGLDDAESGSQCTYYYGPVPEGGVSWGTTWTWNGAPDKVKSFAYAGRQFTRRLLSNITGLPTTVSWSYNKEDIRGNVAYDFFTHPNASHVNSNGEYEVMIWLNRYDGLWPITLNNTGRPIEQVQLGGYDWDLYFGYNGAMKVYSFLSASGSINDFTTDLMLFFKYLGRKHSFPLSKQYLLIDQFGTEAITGQDATFHVSRFQAEVI
ncbi:Endoglucanase cel12B 2 [Colletotrichum chlorophyti]|uniref:Endoglucanase cel12B 2 n=1 Tax=Colletotrichum chlorophyti TaxID=708187 RepID=A0A1Q8RZF6_9PEZI|nr:Endoglucanase cel12B 2 [Colletotrichum chlorophyti]